MGTQRLIKDLKAEGFQQGIEQGVAQEHQLLIRLGACPRIENLLRKS